MYKVTDNNIFITRGDSAEFTLSITGYTPASGDVLTFTVKKNCNDAQALIQKTIDTSDMKIAITHDDTAGLEFGDYWYDVQLKTADSYDTVIIPHGFTIGAEVTW